MLVQWNEPELPTSGFLLFSAAWCVPCLAAHAAAESKETPIYEIDPEQHPEWAQRFEVQALPTLLFLHEREVPIRYSGSPVAKYIQENLK